MVVPEEVGEVVVDADVVIVVDVIDVVKVVVVESDDVTVVDVDPDVVGVVEELSEVVSVEVELKEVVCVEDVLTDVVSVVVVVGVVRHDSYLPGQQITRGASQDSSGGQQFSSHLQTSNTPFSEKITGVGFEHRFVGNIQRSRLMEKVVNVVVVEIDVVGVVVLRAEVVTEVVLVAEVVTEVVVGVVAGHTYL